MSFKLLVEGFPENSNIPDRFTCEGEDLSPALRWSGEPSLTRSFAVMMDDPDAAGGVFSHWLIWDIPPHVHGLPEGNDHEPMGRSGINDFKRHGYNGPAPPKGRGPHRYFFRLFALDAAKLDLPKGARRPAVEQALKKHAIAETAYTGRYQRY